MGAIPQTVFTIGGNAFIPQSRFYCPVKGERFGPDGKRRRNFDNIQRQVRRLRCGEGGDDSARVLIECVGK